MSKKIFIIFVLPVIFSTLFGFLVLDDILSEPDRELKMWSIFYSEDLISYVLVGDKFSKTIDISNSYKTVTDMILQESTNFSINETFLLNGNE